MNSVKTRPHKMNVSFMLCVTCLTVWTGKSYENRSCTTSRKAVHDLVKSRPMCYFGTTNSIPGVQTTKQTAYVVAMTTRYDVVFYQKLLGSNRIVLTFHKNKSNCFKKGCI